MNDAPSRWHSEGRGRAEDPGDAVSEMGVDVASVVGSCRAG